MTDFTFLDPGGIEVIALDTQHSAAGGEGHGGRRSDLKALLGAKASRTLLDDPRSPFTAIFAGDKKGASASIAILQTLRIQTITMAAKDGLARRPGRWGLGKVGPGTGRKAHRTLAEDPWLGVATVVALLVQVGPALGARLGSNRV
jgi:hypothetical protein